MSSDAGVSVLDDALACVGQRIASILIQPADKDKNYIASLHNEVLAAAWIVGLLASGGSSPDVPESVRIAFRCFPNIKDLGTYAAPEESLPLRAGSNIPVDANFNLTRWWEIPEGEYLSKPFDVGEELVAGLLRVLDIRLAGAELRARTIKKFKQVSGEQKEIERSMESLKSFLERSARSGDEKADRLDNLDSPHET